MTNEKPQVRDVANLQEALLIASEEIGFIEFDGDNKSQNYRYASAAAVFRKINKVFADVGLTVSSEKELVHHSETINDKGKTVRYAVVKTTLKVFFYDESERQWQYRTTTGFGSGVDHGDKAIMKAQTAAEKYCYAHLLILGWGAEDPEGDDKTDEESKVVLTAEALADKIADAASIQDLEKWGAAVLGKKGTKDYENLKALYRDRKALLTKP